LAVTIAKDIASGMSHIHKENIMHCDLAARNLLVSLKGKDQYVIKVADFGLSHISESDNYNLKAEAKFPIRWSAPEMMTRGQVSKASDVWSFGVVVWEILQFEKPYSEIASNSEVMKKVCNEGLRLARPTRIQIPDELWEIIQSCWQLDPKSRPTFEQLYQRLADLDARMNKEASPLVFISKTGTKCNYITTAADYHQTPKEGEYSQTPDPNDYTQTPEENSYAQTPRKKSTPYGYGQTPGPYNDNYSTSPFQLKVAD